MILQKQKETRDVNKKGSEMIWLWVAFGLEGKSLELAYLARNGVPKVLNMEDIIQ
ncbi:MAG: hypothetical protein JO327_07330 [Nitrososphaeraceae archaeon]|nr:hypothetical protein [Nitrososphaeraceae archaeon]MBV9667928.1 hypothetical protein [Nitrososphaeraceae archaeon]